MSAYQQLKTIFERYSHLQHVASICQWDEAVMMPPGGAEARVQALASLNLVQHQLIAQPQVGEWIELARQEPLASPWDQANLQWMDYYFKRATCLPEALVSQSTLAFLYCEQAWRHLRAQNDWQAFMPFLAENVRLVRETAHYQAEAFGCDPYDALLNSFSPGVTQELIDPLFAQLQQQLPAMITQRLSQQTPPPSLDGDYSIESQRQLGVAVMELLGFDFNHGRLDVSHHPFCGGVPQDVRITTRYRSHEFISALMAVCHETGHALYNLGLPAEWINQPVGQPLGMAVHESQSLFIEMQICRSLPFLQCLVPLLNRSMLRNSPISVEALQVQYTYVNPGYIRVDADELCYPLHVILRYEIEKQLIAGKVTVAELPQLWDHHMQQFLQLSTENNYTDGVMQDVHWSCGAFGYFPAYTLGAIIAAQLAARLKREYLGLNQDIAQGDFSYLHHWLGQRVYSQGSVLPLAGFIEQATGEALTVDYFISHLRNRYLYSRFE